MQKFKENRYFKQSYQLVSNSLIFPPLVVLIAILVITIWPWQNARQNLANDMNRTMNDQTEVFRTKLNSQFTNYNNILQSGAGILKSNPELTGSQWDMYFQATSLSQNSNGIQAITYIKVFDQSELQQVTDSMMAQGISDFQIKPATPPRQRYSAVLYLYPDTEVTKGVVGIDMLTIEARRQGMQKAIDTGQLVLSEKLKLLQSVPTGDEYGFVIFAPYYKSASDISTPQSRNNNIDGFVAAGFRAKRFFKNILEGSEEQKKYSVKVYDRSVEQKNLLYETSNYKKIAEKNNTQTITKPMKVLDRTWQFVFTFDTTALASSAERNAPSYILIVGIITAFLVFLALLSIFRSRARELQQQKDMEVNIAKDELLSLASHQMRTPATGVKQYLGMVLQGFAGDIDESQKSLLEKAYTSNERQLHVINQILHLAKLESGRIVLAKHQTNLNELISDIVEEQQNDIKSRGHILKLQIPKKQIIQKLDSHMMRMAVENILSNAIKYTIEPGKITVKLTHTVNHIQIIIKDTGIGIESDQYSQIFKQFTRLYDDKTESISGTGVGLYLSDQLVKLHKGTLTVKSEVGKGSQFTIILPKKVIKKQ